MSLASRWRQAASLGCQQARLLSSIRFLWQQPPAGSCSVGSSSSLINSFHRFISCTAAANNAPGSAPQQHATATASDSSAAEPATSFIVSPASGPAAAPLPHAPSAGGVLSGGAAGLKAYTMRQVSKHASDETCWIVVNGKVYDVTSYLDDHPGGSDSILQNAGVDCTEEFMGVHSQEAKELLEKFIIGKVKAGAATKTAKQPATVTSQEAAAAAAAVDPTKPKVLLQDPKERYSLPLAVKQQLNPDTFLMRFALPTPEHRLGLPCGKHVFLCADIGGEGVVRAYTPISGDRDLGVLDFLIKVYWAGVHPRFPEGGKMTQHLAAMKEGDTIDVKGPFGKFTYEGHGKFTLNRVPGKARYLSMVAGGSGVTPCYSVAREVLQDPTDTTRVSLVYANKHEEDVWLRKELNTMAADNPDRFHVWYVVEEPQAATTGSQSAAAALGAAVGSAAAAAGAAPLGMAAATAAAKGAAAAKAGAAAARWPYSTGWVTPDMLAQHLLPPRPVVLPAAAMPQQQQQAVGVSSAAGGGDVVDAVSMALMCGPPGMLENVVVPSLTALGFRSEQMVVF